MSRHPNHLVIDDFLPVELHRGLLDHALDSEADYAPTKTRVHGEGGYRPGVRRSRSAHVGLGQWQDRFEAAIREVAERVREALRMPAFELSRLETELVAHGDGDFFLPHQDTEHSVNRAGTDSDRLVTVVYYLAPAPRRFSGGELALYPFSAEPPLLIEPRDNRLIAFPAFALHEVKPVSVPGGAFADSRFSINCWFHRRRADTAKDQPPAL